MRVHWVVAGQYQMDPAIDISLVKAIGPIWGSWRTWRGCATDNVICHDPAKCRELLDRAFQAVCNFYVPRSHYEFLKRPVGVKLYEGDFNQDVDDVEDIVAMHLAGSQADLILLLGFDLGKIEQTKDKLANHRLVNRHGLIRSIISNQSNVQWVLVDPPRDLDRAYQDLPNLTCDIMENALKLLA